MNAYFPALQSILACLALWPPIASGADNQAEYDDEDAPPSILTPETIFAKEREILRQLTTGDYPFRRGIYKEDIIVKSKTVRLDSGKKISLVWGRPKKAKLAPAVFVIDVESAALLHQPTRRFFNRARYQEKKDKESLYLLNSPFGSNLLGQGFAVAYAIGKDLETLRSARVPDWIEMFDTIRELKAVDENSFFLFSTKEYANLSIYLAGSYSFSGFILETPHYMLFSKENHSNVIAQSERLSPEEIWKRTDPSREAFYRKLFGNIYSPIVLIRSQDSPAFHFNEKTLVHTLKESNTYFESIHLERDARTLVAFDSDHGVMNTEPRVRYNPDSVSRWLEGMITYLKLNSDTQPIELQQLQLIR